MRGSGLTQVIVSGRHLVREKLGHDSWAGSRPRRWVTGGNRTRPTGGLVDGPCAGMELGHYGVRKEGTGWAIPRKNGPWPV
jgi:hypothetical protein